MEHRMDRNKARKKRITVQKESKKKRMEILFSNNEHWNDNDRPFKLFRLT